MKEPPVTDSAVRIVPEVRHSYLAGMVGRVISNRHFPAESSPSAVRAAVKAGHGGIPRLDIPGEDWALVEVPPFSWQGECYPEMRVFLPIKEMEGADG